MTQDANQAELLSWWEGLSFPGKEHYELTDTGTLICKQNGKEKKIANLTAGNYEATYKQFSDKYTELQTRVGELAAEWEKTEDKSKMAGKVERLRENISHANVIGDLTVLSEQVAVLDKVVQEITEANYEEKKKIVAKAEELSNIENFKEGTQAFRDLTEEWKKIGHADKQRSDELWAKIEEAKNKFHERKRKHNEEQEKDMLQNLDLKLELVDKAEQLAASEDWKQTTEAFKALLEEWKKVGQTMHDKNEELWGRFNAAKNNFFDRKRAHGDRIGQEQEANYALKVALVERAEALKDSTEWNKTVQAFSELMEEWKKVGRIPQEKSDEIWARLNAAKDHFFNTKRSHFEARNVEQDNNLIQKQALVQRANAIKNSPNWRDVTEEMNELMEEWKKIGPVPLKVKDTIWEEFNGARKHFFKRKDENRDRHKQLIEKKQGQRVIDSHNFLAKLEFELQDDEARINEFREDVKNVTPGPKEKQLREHLTNLIAEIETGLQSKREKIEKVKKELAELEQQPKPAEKKEHHKEPKVEAIQASPEAETETSPEVATETETSPEAPEENDTQTEKPAE